MTTTTTPSVNAATNRFSAGQGFAYDASGNVVQDTDPVTGHVRSFAFDGENKQREVKDVTNSNHLVGTYLYDGDGRRVKKVTDTETTIFVYDAGGKLVAEYSTATPPGTPQVSYTTTDHLGSPRVITNALGHVTSRRDFMPFGEEIFRANYGTDSVRQKFTGYERDNETGLDFAKARMFGSSLGRFSSPDPRIFGSVFEPGVWNHYGYGLNNPYSFVDTTGNWPEWIHRMITEMAFPGLSGKEIEEIHRGNRRVDLEGVLPDTLNPRKSYQHTMYNSAYNPPGIMEQKRQAFIEFQLAIARNYANRNEDGTPNTAANEAFGTSRHPEQDGGSPAHSGDNSYYETPGPLGWNLYAATSFVVGMLRHRQLESTITEQQLDYFVNKERQAYRTTFGEVNYARATRSAFLMYIIPLYKGSNLFEPAGDNDDKEKKKKNGWEPCPGFVPGNGMTECRWRDD